MDGSDLHAIIIAASGGVLINVMPLWEDARKPKADRAPLDGLFWLFVLLWPVISAGLAYLYILEGSTLKPFLAFSIGLGAPATIRSAMTAVAHLPRRPDDAER